MSVISLGRQTRRTVPLRTVGVLIAAMLLLLVLIVVALAVGTQRRVPAPFGPAANGSIAYVQTVVGYQNQTGYHEPFGDIVAVDPSTGVETTLVGGPELDGEPVYSLDGSRLSFVREVAGGFALYAIDARGGTPTRLTSDPLPTIREAAWSPDGRTVAFTVALDGRSELWLTRSDGSGSPRKLELGVSAVTPQWRPPNGRELLFIGSPQPGIEHISEYHGLYGAEDARELALYLVNADGANVRPITSATGSKFDYAWTSWTPDGRSIVTQRQNAGGYLDIAILDAEGRQLETIAAGQAEDYVAPFVSPDGTRIAYAVVPEGEGEWRLNVRRIDRHGPNVTADQVFVGGAASHRWSPDGTLLIVNQHYDPGTWLVDASTGSARKAPWTDPGYATFQRQAD